MLVVKWDFFSSLKIPINTKLFGKNKTYRGLVFVTIANSIIFTGIASLSPTKLFAWPLPIIGAILGITYILSELPNSLLKRSLGIPPGGKSPSHQFTHRVIDRCDSALGVSIAYTLLTNLNSKSFALLFLAGFLSHTVFSYISYKSGITKSL